MAAKKAKSKMDGGAERAKGRARSQAAKPVRTVNKRKRAIDYKQAGGMWLSNLMADGTLYPGDGWTETPGVDGPMSPIERRAKKTQAGGMQRLGSAPGGYKGWEKTFVPSYFNSAKPKKKPRK